MPTGTTGLQRISRSLAAMYCCSPTQVANKLMQPMAFRTFCDDIFLLSVGAFRSHQAGSVVAATIRLLHQVDRGHGSLSVLRLPYDPPNDFVVGEWGRRMGSFNGSTFGCSQIPSQQ